MSEIINHEEAEHLAILKQGESNLARCYLDAIGRISNLEEALRDFKSLYHDEWGGEGQTDASFCAAYERVYLKHANQK